MVVVVGSRVEGEEVVVDVVVGIKHAQLARRRRRVGWKDGDVCGEVGDRVRVLGRKRVDGGVLGSCIFVPEGARSSVDSLKGKT